MKHPRYIGVRGKSGHGKPGFYCNYLYRLITAVIFADADPEQEMISQTKEFKGEPYGAAEERAS